MVAVPHRIVGDHAHDHAALERTAQPLQPQVCVAFLEFGKMLIQASAFKVEYRLPSRKMNRDAAPASRNGLGWIGGEHASFLLLRVMDKTLSSLYPSAS